jgi:hypothetical protein
MLMPARVVATFTDEQTRRVQLSASGRHALLHVRGEAGYVVDAQLAAGAVHGLRQRHVAGRVRRLADERHGRDGDALVGDGHAVRRLHLERGGHQPVGRARDLVVDALAGAVQIAGRAVAQRDAHGHRADVEVLGLDHPQRFA